MLTVKNKCGRIFLRLFLGGGVFSFFLSAGFLPSSCAAGNSFLLTMKDHASQNLSIQSRPLPDRDLAKRGTGTPQNLSPLVERGVKLWDEAALGTTSAASQPYISTGNVVVTVAR